MDARPGQPPTTLAAAPLPHAGTLLHAAPSPHALPFGGNADLVAAHGLIDALAEVARRVNGGDPTASKRALLEALAAAVGADAFTWALTRTPAPGDPRSVPVVLLRLDGNFDAAQRQVLVEAQRAAHYGVFVRALYERVHRDGRATARRADLLDDGTWFESSYRREVAGRLGLDEFAIAIRRIGAADVSTLMFLRAAGRPGFDLAALDLLSLAMDRVAWLHEHGPLEPLANPMMSLSPRERQVVRLLLAGENQKGIAAALKLSRHTVNDYQKIIYRHFDVSSRGELQARFAAGQTPPRQAATPHK